MPMRRYLRISRYSTLEVRIHVTGSNRSWFTDSMLRDAIQLIKPLVLPKLREETNAKKKKKRNPTKDEVVGDGFIASFFLEDVQTKHTVLNVNKSLEFVQKIVEERPAYTDSSPLFIQSQEDEDEDIKDKPTLKTSYSGFRIFDKALWLIVRPTDVAQAGPHRKQNKEVLDSWIAMTQEQQGAPRLEATV